jgi:aspartyl/asparaginyl beta-hydroxylase (cupin superfamily)
VTIAASDLYARASQAWEQGRPAEARGLLEALIETDPDDVAALNTLGLIALNAGDAGQAAGRFERAAALAPGAPGLWFNLFQALDLAGDLDGALGSLDRALSADPYYVPAVLMKAGLLDRIGRRPEALAIYRAILATGPNAESLPEPARRALAEGLALVRADDDRRSAALSGPLAEVRAAFPGADLSRAEAYSAQRTGRRKVYVQQPINGHFPYLPAFEYFDRSHFPWLAELEARAAEIRSELQALMAEGDRGFGPYIAFEPTQPVNQWAELNHSPRWSAWFFWRDGERQQENCARCPATAEALAAAPLLDIPGKGPTAMFSILGPRTRIPPHTGSDNVRATVHLPLIVPEGCGLRVGAESRTFRAGEAWAFDDTIEHEAWNDSDAPRAILILDVWNPLLSEAERAVVRAVG